ncbi:hypothetical protein OEZ86_006474 [Tetradesmus obliquus]|uniref:ComEC/Rec2-related protein domain-containing protein n=1 Tax=Tetradesmus obliquus TaxID=3088 RepID=A0ABY8U0I7_TETOB|nr:hypothetical protein OEZ85_006780 [Tetradesmus obliquus]WIA33337.1 hypothetical protein OEZ86_006474 [Tetradesmus obliquus]
MLAKAILGPFYLPVLQLVTLATLPAAGLYAIGGLLASPLVIPALILKNLAVLAIFTPFLLLTLPVALPVGFVLAALCLTHEVCKALFITFTPLLWPLYFLCKWWKISCIVSQVIVTDTIMPWLVPLRFTFIAAILPKLAMS